MLCDETACKVGTMWPFKRKPLRLVYPFRDLMGAMRAKDPDLYEGKFDAIRRRHEREYDKYGPSPEERFNQGRGYEE